MSMRPKSSMVALPGSAKGLAVWLVRASVMQFSACRALICIIPPTSARRGACASTGIGTEREAIPISFQIGRFFADRPDRRAPGSHWTNDQADISAQEAASGQGARLPRAHVFQGWPEGSGGSPGKGAQEADRLTGNRTV